MSSVQPEHIPLDVRLKWATQAAEAVSYIHARHVIHCDIHPNNFLVDGALDLRLWDFSGSVFGDLDGCAMESTRFWLPRDVLAAPTIRCDLFALGSAIYYFMSEREPYDDLAEEEVAARYSRGEFPDVEELTCGQNILPCWKGDFGDAEEVFGVLLERRSARSLS